MVDSRLGAWLAKDADLKVWLKCQFGVRAKRISGRENITVKEAERRIKARDASDAGRYRKFYGIDLSDLSVYDLIIDTERFDPEQIVAIIMTAINK